MHFLVEDFYLFSAFASSEQGDSVATKSVSLLSLAEFEHLDDLVIPSDPPASVSGSGMTSHFTASILAVKQTSTPILTPPKAI